MRFERLEKEVEALKSSSEDNILPPPLVANKPGGAIHINLYRSSFPPLRWKTKCGWEYYGKPYVFKEKDVAPTEQGCEKGETKVQ